MTCLIQLFSATVFQEYSLKNSCRWTTPPPCYLTFIMCFYLGAEGHIGCLKTLLKDMLVVWRCWKYWAGCLATLSVTWWGKFNTKRKKKIEKMLPTKMRKQVILPQKCNERRAKNLAVKWTKENLTIKKRKSLSQKEKKEIWRQNKKRLVTKKSKARIIIITIIKTKMNENTCTIEIEKHIVCQFCISFLQLHVL